MLRLSAALLTLGLAAAAPAQAECVVGKIADLPVTMMGLRPTVEVSLDGKPMRLAVSSASFFGDLSLSAVADLRLKTYFAPANLELVRSDDSRSRVTLARVKSFGFGGVTVPDVEFLVTGGSHGGETAIAGVLGRNVLSYADTEYDFAHGQLRLLAPKGCSDRAVAYWSSDPSALPMRSARIGATSAEAFIKINGVDLLARFDTGRSYTTLTRSGARKAGLDVHGPSAKPAGAGMARDGKLIQTWLLPVSEVRIGDEIIRDTKVRIVDRDTNVGAGDIAHQSIDVLIGADFFLSHRVYMANGQRKIYFTYNGGPVFDLSAKPAAALDAAVDDSPARPTP